MVGYSPKVMPKGSTNKIEISPESPTTPLKNSATSKNLNIMTDIMKRRASVRKQSGNKGGPAVGGMVRSGTIKI